MKNYWIKRLCCLMLSMTILEGKADKSWPPGSALHTASIFSEEQHGYEKKTDAMMHLIYANIDDVDINRAIKSQITAWHKYKEAACAVIGLSTGAGGSWPTTYTVGCERGLSYDRHFATKNALQCIKRTEKDKGTLSYEKIACLIQTFNVKLF